jgi:hypothetical protein
MKKLLQLSVALNNDQYPGLAYPFEDWDLNDKSEYDLGRFLHRDAKVLGAHFLLHKGGNFISDCQKRIIKFDKTESTGEQVDVGDGVCEVTISMNDRITTYFFYVLAPEQEYRPSIISPKELRATLMGRCW